MAKRVHPLLSVSGNFGKYGGAHNIHGTAIGATHMGPHHQLYFRGVIRAADENKRSLNQTSDEKSEVTRRMSHGAEAYLDRQGLTVLPRHPHTERAPIVLREADGNPTLAGWHFRERGGAMPQRFPRAPPPPGPLADTNISQKNRAFNPPPDPAPPAPPRRRLKKKMERDPAPAADAPRRLPENKISQKNRAVREVDEIEAAVAARQAPGFVLEEALADVMEEDMPAERALRDPDADLFGDDDEEEPAPIDRPRRPEPPTMPPQEAAPSRSPSKESSSSSSSSSSSAAPVPAAGSADVNPLDEPDPAVPVVDDIEEFRALLPILTPAETRQLQHPLRSSEEDGEGKIEFMGKKISAALRKQYLKMINDEIRKRTEANEGKPGIRIKG